MKTLKEKIEVMQAALDGKEIEFNDGCDWGPCQIMAFDSWRYGDYRIKPEPMEFWLNVPVNRDMGFSSKAEAEAEQMRCLGDVIAIKVRQVMDEA